MKNRTVNIPRRRTLWYLMALGLALLGAKVSTFILSFLQPPPPKNSFGGMVVACTLDDIVKLDKGPQHHGKGRFWLVRTKEGMFALYNSCTHLECLFSWDQVNNIFICPCHGSEFSLTGEILRGPATKGLNRFSMQVVGENGEVVLTSSKKGKGGLHIDSLLRRASISDGSSSTAKMSSYHILVDTSEKLDVATHSASITG